MPLLLWEPEMGTPESGYIFPDPDTELKFWEKAGPGFGMNGIVHKKCM